jgi:DNA-binding NtrC family response regulator
MTSSAVANESHRRPVVILTSDAEAASAMRTELSRLASLTHAQDLESLYLILEASSRDVLIADIDSVAQDTRQAEVFMESIRERFPSVPVIALSRSRAITRCVRRKGATHALVAPVDPDQLIQTVTSVLTGDEPETLSATSSRRSLAYLIGVSEPMQRVYDAILRLADSNSTVLIRGESGSGKELAARAIVSLGKRATKPFISLNCAALPETLIETELFGHEKGAYTGADRSRPGHIELAHTGTVFLDEIATLTLPLQSKLLRVLEDREVRRIGGSSARSIDFRLITATNEDLEDMVKKGRFREDLYYRINVVPLDLPPLRDRDGDIPLLVDHYLKRFCGSEGIEMKHVDPEVLDILEEYRWPGNVRELENLIQRLVLMVTSTIIQPRHLPKNVLYATTTQHESLLIPEQGIDFEKELQRIEEAYLRAALRRSDGRKADAGKLLKLTPRQMKYLCQKHGL